MTRKSFRLTVRGRVQGVSYRASLCELARRHRIDGWVRNMDDGSVEAVVSGEEVDLEVLIAWSRMGPPGASVASVSVDAFAQGVEKGFWVAD